MNRFQKKSRALLCAIYKSYFKYKANDRLKLNGEKTVYHKDKKISIRKPHSLISGKIDFREIVLTEINKTFHKQEYIKVINDYIPKNKALK